MQIVSHILKCYQFGLFLNMNDANGNSTAYDELFMADNDINGAQNEFIFTLNLMECNHKHMVEQLFLFMLQLVVQ